MTIESSVPTTVKQIFMSAPSMIKELIERVYLQDGVVIIVPTEDADRTAITSFICSQSHLLENQAVHFEGYFAEAFDHAACGI